MVYNMDFLIAAMVILLLILWNFLGQKRADDLYPPQQRDHGTGKGVIARGRRHLSPSTID